MTINRDYDLKDFEILKLLMVNPESSQAAIAKQLNVAVGTVNWRLRRLVADHALEIHPCKQRKCKYVLTPNGEALMGSLETECVQEQFRAFRVVREQAVGHLAACRERNFTEISIVGEGDAAEICRLTALELGILPTVTTKQDAKPDQPLIEIIGLILTLSFGEEPEGEGAICKGVQQ